MSLFELLEFVLESIKVIQKRFLSIDTSDDFLKDDNGLEKLDSIIMRIQTIGEALKNIDKHKKGFLESVAPSEYWSNIIKLRDLISHHYIDIDSETIFMICNEKLDELENKVAILLSLSK
jgi:uncharacterized protein with HEPN domain